MAQPAGRLSPEQLTQLAHAVRLHRLTPFTLAKVVPLVGWLHEPAWRAVVAGLAAVPAAWEATAPGRTGGDGSAGELVWELPLQELQGLIDRMWGPNESALVSSRCISMGSVEWGLQLTAKLANPLTRTHQHYMSNPPGSVMLGLCITAGHAAPGLTAPFRLGREVEVARADGGPPARCGVSLAEAQLITAPGQRLEFGGGEPVLPALLPTGRADDPTLAPFCSTNANGQKVLRLTARVTDIGE
jgi:hypothetical protein